MRAVLFPVIEESHCYEGHHQQVLRGQWRGIITIIIPITIINYILNTIRIARRRINSTRNDVSDISKNADDHRLIGVRGRMMRDDDI